MTDISGKMEIMLMSQQSCQPGTGTEKRIHKSTDQGSQDTSPSTVYWAVTEEQRWLTGVKLAASVDGEGKVQESSTTKETLGVDLTLLPKSNFKYSHV